MALRPLEISAKRKRRSKLALELKDAQKRQRQLRNDEAALEKRVDAAEEVTPELEQEVQETVEAIAEVESQIEDIQAEIDAIDEALASEGVDVDPPAEPAARSRSGVPTPGRSVGPVDSPNYRSRSRCFTSRSQRDAFYQRDDMKQFLQRVRDMAGSGRRSVTGAELTIPQVMLDLIRDNLGEHSKLISRVRLRNVNGNARANVLGQIPEGIWTEMCAKLNELDFVFNQLEVDGFKVGGFIAICNATLEDSDVNLGEEILDMLLAAIGLALDKAIIYGKGPASKMPVGFVTRLAQTVQPGYWGANEGEWTDLSATNIQKLDLWGTAGEEFFAPLLGALGTASPKYSRGGGTFWVMNRKTHMDLMARGLAFNSAGTLVAGLGDKMPVENGDIIELEFVPDYEIVGGFGDLYMMVERKGATVGQSEHVMFIEEHTVFKASARYDGKPIRGEGFVAVNYNNTAPTTAIDFALAKE